MAKKVTEEEDSCRFKHGRPSTLRQWCSPPCFRFPLFPKHFLGLRRKFSQFYLFQKIFIRQNFWRPFLSHWPQTWNFPPISAVSIHFPSYFGKFLCSPYSSNLFIPWFLKCTCSFTYFMCFSFPPYSDHDAFMHHTMHLPDAPGSTFG